MTDPGIRRRAGLLLVAAAASIAAGATGCSGSSHARAKLAKASASPGTTPSLPPAAQLAARAALARDQYYTASYRFVPADGSPAGTGRLLRSRAGVRLDLTRPAYATSVKHTTVVVQNRSGTFYCLITHAAKGCVAAPSADQPPQAGGDPQVPAGDDPRMQHAFADWLTTLGDPSAALSVALAPAPRGATGTCFSVESVAASLEPPVDPGLYCFDNVGKITALRLALGALTLVEVGPAPAAVALPAAVGTALPSTAVPHPVPTAASPRMSPNPPPKGKTSPSPQ